MAGAVVEKGVCRSCGVPVRETSSFCYACGESVLMARDVDIEAVDNSHNGGSIDEDATLLIREADVTAKPLEVEISPDALPAESKPELRSAASVRRKAKAYNRKPVEIVWAERERSPTAFIVVSILLVIFAGVLLGLALYMK
ncbi:MAG: zinc ribbon domain-containing protein [Pyrinomonadaceae bacterium]